MCILMPTPEPRVAQQRVLQLGETTPGVAGVKAFIQHHPLVVVRPSSTFVLAPNTARTSLAKRPVHRGPSKLRLATLAHVLDLL